MFPGLQRSVQKNQFTEKELSWFQGDKQESSKPTDCVCTGCEAVVEKTEIDEVIVCVKCGEVVERSLERRTALQ